MAFNTTVFSTDGLNLLAQLSVTKSLRIKHIYVDETEHAASDFNQSPSWWMEQTNLTMIKVVSRKAKPNTGRSKSCDG